MNEGWQLFVRDKSRGVEHLLNNIVHPDLERVVWELRTIWEPDPLERHTEDDGTVILETGGSGECLVLRRVEGSS